MTDEERRERIAWERKSTLGDDTCGTCPECGAELSGHESYCPLCDEDSVLSGSDAGQPKRCVCGTKIHPSDDYCPACAPPEPDDCDDCGEPMYFGDDGEDRCPICDDDQEEEP